jgi:hypothetical protein
MTANHRTPSTLESHRLTLYSSYGVRLAGDKAWDDARYPFFGRQLDISAGHLTYDVAELGVNFDDTSRYNDLDQIGIIAQMSHSYAIGTALHPHIHWMQSNANVPNMLLKYRVYDNGETPSAWTLAAVTTHAFTYTSGTILQLSSWPTIDMSSITGVSGFVDVKVYRDTANASTVFAGADPLVGDWLAKEFDFHFQVDSMGSGEEYAK